MSTLKTFCSALTRAYSRECGLKARISALAASRNLRRSATSPWKMPSLSLAGNTSNLSITDGYRLATSQCHTFSATPVTKMSV